MATEAELRKALQAAIDDGNTNAARQIAQSIAAGMNANPDGPFSEAAAKQSAVQGSLADRERMTSPEYKQQQERELGTLKGFAGNAARAPLDMAGFVGGVIGNIPQGPGAPLGGPEALRDFPQTMDRAGTALGLPPHEDSMAGQAGSFVGAGLTGGLGNIARATGQAGLRGLAGSTGRNVGASLAASGGAEIGGSMAEDVGLPRAVGEVPGMLIPGGVTSLTGKLSGANQAQRAENSLVAKEALGDAKKLGLFPEKGTGLFGNWKKTFEGMPALSAGIASPNSFVKFSERLLASVPGGMRVMHEFARNLNARLTSTLQKMTGPQDIGTAGITISGGIQRRVKNINRLSTARYARVAKEIPDTHLVRLTEFETELARLQQQSPAAVADLVKTLRGGKDDILPQIAEGLATAKKGEFMGTPFRRKDLQYNEADAIRRAIGQSLKSKQLIADSPQLGELKSLYAAVSKDMSASLNGSQKRAFDFATESWAKDRTIVDGILNPIAKGTNNPNSEAIYRALFKSGGENASSLREVYRGLTRAEREVVTKTFIARMGKVGDEALSAAGEIPLNPNFRMESFITNWRKLPNESKDILFAGQHQFRQNMDTFTRYIDRVLETNKAMANPSQSGPVGLAAATAFLTMAGLGGAGIGYAVGDEKAKDSITGGLLGVAGIVGAAKGTGSMARLMTNPKFVSWLARGTRVPIKKTPEHFARLSVLASGDNEFAADISVFLEQLSNITDERLLHGPRTELQGVQ